MRDEAVSPIASPTRRVPSPQGDTDAERAMGMASEGGAIAMTSPPPVASPPTRPPPVLTSGTARRLVASLAEDEAAGGLRAGQAAVEPVRVSIGRIEVVGRPPPTPPRPAGPPVGRPRVSLGEYLRRREGRDA